GRQHAARIDCLQAQVPLRNVEARGQSRDRSAGRTVAYNQLFSRLLLRGVRTMPPIGADRAAVRAWGEMHESPRSLRIAKGGEGPLARTRSKDRRPPFSWSFDGHLL